MLKEYVVCLHEDVDYNSFWDAMEKDSSFPHIPNRPIDIANEKIGMDRSCHYYLTDEEASVLTQDSRIYCVEIPVHLRDDIQIGRLLVQNGNFTKTNTSVGSFVNWGLVRVNSPTNLYGTANTTTANYGYNLDATGVDVVISDSGIQADHPEFTNRVQLVDWYAISGVSGTQSANHYRDYDGHGTHVAGIAAGQTYGWAKNARIYSLKVSGLEGTGDSGTGISVTDCFNVIKNWHLTKPINPKTGFRRPTIVNMSWGYSSGYNTVSFVNHRGTAYNDGSTTGDANYRWFYYGIAPASGTSTTYVAPVRVNSVDVDVQELVKAGVIVCIAAGNSYFKIDNEAGLDYNNYVVTNAGTVYYHRGMSPYSNTAIIVGSVDSNSYSSNLDQKATYSNAGPGVDIYSPGSNVMSATSTTNIRSGVAYYANASYKQLNISGTSMAAPQVVGAGALYLSMNPDISPALFKQWLKRNAASNVLYSSNVDADYTNTRSIYSGNNYILYNPFGIPNNGTFKGTPTNYSVTPSVTLMDETSSNVVVFSVAADILGNETIYYNTNTVSGNLVSFTTANTGSFNIVRSTTLTFQAPADRYVDGVRIFNLELRRNSLTGPIIVTSANVTVNDSSIPTVASAPVMSSVTYPTYNVGVTTSANISFSPSVDDGNSTITSYVAVSNPGYITGSNASSPVFVSGLTKGQTYSFVVYAVNGVGNSANSNVSANVTPITVPASPTIGTGTASLSSTSVANIAFTPPADTGGSPITNYTAISTPGSFSFSNTNSHITFTGLSAGTGYTFVVNATNAIGTSQNSAPSNTTTTLLPQGQQGYITVGTYSFVPPTGVSSISVVAIGAGGGGGMGCGYYEVAGGAGGDSYFNAPTTVRGGGGGPGGTCGVGGPYTGDGGGVGGNGYNPSYPANYARSSAGGGGAGGYCGTGGHGGHWQNSSDYPAGAPNSAPRTNAPATSATGRGGGGGQHGGCFLRTRAPFGNPYNSFTFYAAGGGGGVNMYGGGSNGAAGTCESCAGSGGSCGATGGWGGQGSCAKPLAQGGRSALSITAGTDGIRTYYCSIPSGYRTGPCSGSGSGGVMQISCVWYTAGGGGGGFGGGGGSAKMGYNSFCDPGGSQHGSKAGGGGGLGYKNNYPVTPGTPYTVVIGRGGYSGVNPFSGPGTGGTGASGAVRIIWGSNRTFPTTNTANALVIT